MFIQNDYVDLIAEFGLTWHVTDEVTRRRVVGGVLQDTAFQKAEPTLQRKVGMYIVSVKWACKVGQSRDRVT